MKKYIAWLVAPVKAVWWILRKIYNLDSPSEGFRMLGWFLFSISAFCVAFAALVGIYN